MEENNVDFCLSFNKLSLTLGEKAAGHANKIIESYSGLISLEQESMKSLSVQRLGRKKEDLCCLFSNAFLDILLFLMHAM